MEQIWTAQELLPGSWLGSWKRSAPGPPSCSLPLPTHLSSGMVSAHPSPSQMPLPIFFLTPDTCAGWARPVKTHPFLSPMMMWGGCCMSMQQPIFHLNYVEVLYCTFTALFSQHKGLNSVNRALWIPPPILTGYTDFLMIVYAHLVCSLLELQSLNFFFISETTSCWYHCQWRIFTLVSFSCTIIVSFSCAIISRANEVNWVKRNAWAVIFPSCCSFFTREYGVYCAWRWLVRVGSVSFTIDFLVTAFPSPSPSPR